MGLKIYWYFLPTTTLYLTQVLKKIFSRDQQLTQREQWILTEEWIYTSKTKINEMIGLNFINSNFMREI